MFNTEMLIEFLRENPIPVKHQFGKAIAGAIGGVAGTVLAKKAYEGIFRLAKYSVKKKLAS